MYKITFSPLAVTLIFFSFLKCLVSPSVERKCASNPTSERGRRTPQHCQETRDRERTTENKENVAAHSKEVDLFALPPPRTPVSSKKNARQKNVLNTPNQNSTVTKGHTGTPRGERRLPLTHQIMKRSGRQLYLFTVIDFPHKRRRWSQRIFFIFIILFARASAPLPFFYFPVCLSSSCSSRNNKCHIHTAHICN